MKRCALSFALFVAAALACRNVYTTGDLADRARAVEFFGLAGSQLGLQVSGVGDVNADGFDDFVVAAPFEGNDKSGAIFLVFGRSSAAWVAAPAFDFNASLLPSDPTSLIKIRGIDSFASIGSLGVEHGDYNGDGVEDIFFSSKVSKAFVVYGHQGAWASFSTTSIENGNVRGFTVTGFSGSVVYMGNAGDANGDGIDDILVVDSTTGAHVPCVVFGIAGSTRSAFDVTTIDGENGFKITALRNGYLGTGIPSSPGDINGDGLADFALGSFEDNSYAGHAYFVFSRNVSRFGSWSAVLNVSELDGTNGFAVYGTDGSGSAVGHSIQNAGDVNADGFDDAILGSNSASAGGWVIFGHAAPWATEMGVSSLFGNNGFHFYASSFDGFGTVGAGAGDVNGDGIDDVVVSAKHALDSTGTDSGIAAAVFGHSGSWEAEMLRTNVAGSVGFLVDGPSAGSEFGWSVAGVGDVNGDGAADFVVGAPFANSNAGYAALVFGVADHCASCSATADVCLVCDNGFEPNGEICVATASPSSSSSFTANAFPSSSSSEQGAHSSATASSSSEQQQGGTVVVVVIHFNETINNTTELQDEIANALGIDAGLVSVVVISPTEVQVTIIGSEETAQHLVDIINNGGSGSGLGLLRKAIDAHIRKDTNDNGSSDDDGIDSAPHVALFHPTALLFLLAIATAAV